jgi:hypothetical protein
LRLCRLPWSRRSSPTGPNDHPAWRSKITSSSEASFSCSASTGCFWAIAGGELPIELTARGARFAEKAAEDSLRANREVFERLRSLEVDLAEQETRSEVDGREATRSLSDFQDDLAGLRTRLGALERRVG